MNEFRIELYHRKDVLSSEADILVRFDLTGLLISRIPELTNIIRVVGADKFLDANADKVLAWVFDSTQNLGDRGPFRGWAYSTPELNLAQAFLIPSRRSLRSTSVGDRIKLVSYNSEDSSGEAYTYTVEPVGFSLFGIEESTDAPFFDRGPLQPRRTNRIEFAT